MDPWYRVVTPRKEVREGRSFSPDEFAIALEQVVAGTAPPDYTDPSQFFSRTVFTRALKEHAGMVLRRLAGETANTAPVLTLVSQFGGGKTHTLTSLYHLTNAGEEAAALPGVAGLLGESGLTQAPSRPGRSLRRECLGSERRTRDTVDRSGPPTRRRTRGGCAWARCTRHGARY